jgi:hypothetical protein
MRRLFGSMMLMLVAAGCANQLALSELSARNTVPPPGTQNRIANGGNGYYNPLSYFQSNAANANPSSFTPPAPNQGLATGPIAAAPSSRAETTSPFWNLPGAAVNTPSQPPADRWTSRGNATGASSFGGNSSGFNSVPNRGASSFGNSGFGSNGFGNSGYQNRGPASFGGNSAPANSTTTSSNPLGDLFTKLFGAAPANRSGGVGSVNNWNQPPPNSSGFAARPNPAPQTPPRFDFGAPRGPAGDSEPAIKISDSALRELPRNPRGVSATPDTTRASSPAAPLARQPAAPINNLPAAPPTARPLPQQDGEYIEITRLPVARTAT